MNENYLANSEYTAVVFILFDLMQTYVMQIIVAEEFPYAFTFFPPPKDVVRSEPDALTDQVLRLLLVKVTWNETSSKKFYIYHTLLIMFVA